MTSPGTFSSPLLTAAEPEPRAEARDEMGPDAAITEFHDEADAVALVEAARDLVHHIGWMLDDWAEMGVGDQRNRELWSPLHQKAEKLRALIPGEGER